MLFSLSRWRPRHLLASWLTYWVGLGAVTLGPAVRAISRVAGADGGSVNASGGDNGITLNVLLNGETLFTGTASLMKLAILIAGPPIVLWAAWLIRRPARAQPALSAAGEPMQALQEPMPDGFVVARTPDRAHRRPDA
ncbi:MAG: hypothetical protein AB1762_04670 [Gemmatimonadota bacterium]